MTAPGHFGLDVHNNFVFSGGNAVGDQTAGHRYRLTPEFYYGLAPTIELGIYLLTSKPADGDARANGAKVRIKYIAQHDATSGFFWGANLEIGDTDRRVSVTPWNVELKTILGVRRGAWIFALNPNLDWSLSAHGGPATLNVDFKVARSVGPRTQLGVESYNDVGPLGDLPPPGAGSKILYAALDQDLGKIDLNVGLGRGLNRESEGWTLKFIVGSRF